MHSGTQAVSVGVDRKVKVWDLKTGQCVRTLEGHSKGVRCVIASDFERVISGSADQQLRLWNLTSGACEKVYKKKFFRLGHSGELTAAAINDSGDLFGAANDKTIIQWDIDTGNAVRKLKGLASTAYCLAAVGANMFAGCADGAIRCWRTYEGDSCIQSVSAHKDSVWAISGEGDRLVSGGGDCVVNVWAVSAVGCTLLSSLEGHKNIVRAVAVSLAARRVVSGSYDETIRVWDLTDFSCYGSFQSSSWVVSLTLFKSSPLETSVNTVATPTSKVRYVRSPSRTYMIQRFENDSVGYSPGKPIPTDIERARDWHK